MSGGIGLTRSHYGHNTVAMKSGLYYSHVGSSTTGAPSLGNLVVYPFFLGNTVVLDRIGLEVTGAGAGGSVVRLGIFQDTGTGTPGALLLDAGTIDGTSATVQEITISLACAPQLLWVGAVSQSATCTYRLSAGASPSIGSTAAGISATGSGSYQEGSVTGALPATFTTSPAVTVNTPRVFLRAA